MNRFLECCAEIEDLAAAVYTVLAKKAGNERLQMIMERMAADEEDHARQLRFATRVSAKETFEGVNEKAGDPYALKLRMQQLLAQAGAGVHSEYELLKICVELENSFRSIHAGHALVFKDESFRKLFNALARGDQAHMAELNDYLKDYKQRTATT